MSQSRPHPIVFTALIAPFGVVSGFTTVALGFLGNRHGLSVAEVATLGAVGMFPHTWKFVWAPVVDTTMSRKRWYLLSVALCALGVLSMSLVPLGTSTLRLMQGIILLTNVATTTLGMAVEGLMAHTTPPEERGRAGGWFQAGNLGGGGIGGGLGLWMMTHLAAPWMAGAALATTFVLLSLALTRLPEVHAESRDVPLPRAMGGALVDLWQTVKAMDGRLAALLCFLPVGTGAALGVLAQSDVAGMWGAGETEVGLVNGTVSGALTAVACVVGGELCARFPSRTVYAGVGALMAAVALAMAASPLTPMMFIAFGVLYSIVTGLAYAAFTGLVMEVIGAGAAATKYNVFASLSNTPIMYMGLVLASAFTEYGPRGMLAVEAVAGLAGIAVFLAAVRLARGRAAVEPTPG